MTVSWLAAFKVIPWADLIDNAPAVVRGAKKLWGLVGGTPGEPGPGPHTQAMSTLDARVASLEQEIGHLKVQANGAANLISTLAEQNARLIEAVEILRLRTRVLLVASAVLALGSVVVAVVLLR